MDIYIVKLFFYIRLISGSQKSLSVACHIYKKNYQSVNYLNAITRIQAASSQCRETKQHYHDMQACTAGNLNTNNYKNRS